MHPFPIRRIIGSAMATLLFTFAPTSFAQQSDVKYIPTPLSDTITMIRGRGGNIAICRWLPSSTTA
jgi:hypothetical protein